MTWTYHGPALESLTHDELLATCRWAFSVLASDDAKADAAGQALSAQLEDADRILRERRAAGRLDDCSDYVRARIRYWAAENPHRDVEAVWCLAVRDARAAGHKTPSPADTVRILREGTAVTVSDHIWLVQLGIALEPDA